jgi:hypothetical protein
VLTGGDVTEKLDFCDAWQYSSRDKNVSLTIEKCDADSRTLVLKAAMKDTKNLTVSGAKAKVESKTALKSLSTGTCTAAKEADCTDLAKAGTSFTNSSPTYKDGAYVIADSLTEKDLPKYYQLTFDKGDKLAGTVIKFGVNTEALTFNDDGTYFKVANGEIFKGQLVKNYGSFGYAWLNGLQLFTGTAGDGWAIAKAGGVNIVGWGAGATCTAGKITPLTVTYECSHNGGTMTTTVYSGQPIVRVQNTAGQDFIVVAGGLERGLPWSAVYYDGNTWAYPNGDQKTSDAFKHILTHYKSGQRMSWVDANDGSINTTIRVLGGAGNGYSAAYVGMQGDWADEQYLSGSLVDAFYYFPAVEGTVTDWIDDYDKFHRTVTSLTVNQGTLTASTNVSMNVNAASGANPGCDVYFTSNATLWNGAPMYADCSLLYGTEICFYNKTGSGAIAAGNLWGCLKNESGGWNAYDSGDSLIGAVGAAWNETYADTNGNTGILLTGNDYRFFITNVTVTPPSIPAYSNIVISPASPQTYPISPTWFNITWTDDTSEIAGANLTLDGIVHQQQNESSTYYVLISDLPTGTLAYVFNAVDTAASVNSTASADYIVNKKPVTLALNSSSGWTINEGVSTTVGCTGDVAGLFKDHMAVSNPYAAVTPAAGSYNYSCNVTNTANYTGSDVFEILTVSPIGLTITVLDETPPNAAVTANITLSNSSYSVTYYNVNYLHLNYANASLPKGSVTVAVAAVGYGQRNYYVTEAPGIDNVFNAYLLSTAVGSYVRFHVLTITDAGIANAHVQINRTIGGFTTLIGEQDTDATGTSLFFLNPLVTYTVWVTKTGYTSSLSNVAPSQSDYKIYLTSPVVGGNISTQFSDVTFSIIPAGCGLTNGSQTFIFTITSTNNSLANGWGMNITVNGTTLLFNGSSNNPTGGTITTTLNLTNYSGQVLTMTLYMNHTLGYYSWRYDCPIFDHAVGLSDYLAALPFTICAVPVNSMGILWCPPLAIIALIISMLVGGATALKFSVNGGGIGAMAALWCFVFVGWFPWSIALAITLGMIGLITLRGGIS